MQICSWYTEHEKPLPGLFFDLRLSFQMSCWSLASREANIVTGHLDGKKKWRQEKKRDRERERPNKKAETTAEAVGFALILWTSHWHKGFGQGQYPWIASPTAELLGAPSTLRPRAAADCFVSGAFCFLPVLSLSSPKQTKDLAGRDTLL